MQPLFIKYYQRRWAVTRLKRKAKRNKTTAKVRVATIQRLNSKPVIQGVDVDKVKEEFEKSAKKAAPKKTKAKAKEVVAEATEAVADAPEAKEAPAKAEKKTTKKAAPKKEKAPKAEAKEDTKDGE